MGQRLVETIARKISVADLAAAGVMAHAGTAELRLSWRGEHLAAVAEFGADRIELRFKALAQARSGGGVVLEQTIVLVATPQHFGGRRWWFRCNATGQRCTTLYRPAGSVFFASRKALGLAYQSTRRSPYARRLDRLWTLRGELGIDESMLVPVGCFERPKGMWEATWRRKLARIERLECAADEHLAGVVARMTR